jgi:hypothetical protein
MSECPSYYRTANGREFWEVYSTFCQFGKTKDLTHDQAHALASACEYLFRAGRKTPDPREDFRKALSLIRRVYLIQNPNMDSGLVEDVVYKVLGWVVWLKMDAEVAEVPQVVDLSQGGPFDATK